MYVLIQHLHVHRSSSIAKPTSNKSLYTVRQAIGAFTSNVVMSRNVSSTTDVLAAVLGSRNVEMLETNNLIIHGLRASRPAKVMRA